MIFVLKSLQNFINYPFRADSNFICTTTIVQFCGLSLGINNIASNLFVFPDLTLGV